jgi:hypothetical protein
MLLNLRTVLVASSLLFGGSALLSAETRPDRDEEEGRREHHVLDVGEVFFFDLGVAISALAVGDEEVLTATMISPQSMVVTAKAPGTTNMIVFDIDKSPVFHAKFEVGHEGRRDFVIIHKGVTQTLVCRANRVCREISEDADIDLMRRHDAPKSDDDAGGSSPEE